MVLLYDIKFPDLDRPLNTREVQRFIKALWQSTEIWTVYSLSSFLDLLQIERTRAARHKDPKFRHLEFRDILSTTSLINEHQGKSCKDLCEAVSVAFASRIPSLPLVDETIRDLIKLTIRLWILVKIDFKEPTARWQRQLHFGEGQTLQDALKRLHTSPLQQDADPFNDFPVWFNVVDLERITGLRIAWADYITDHLAIMNGTLYLFQNIEALKQIRGSNLMFDESGNTLFTREFIQETINTVFLLFPIKSEHDFGDWLVKGSRSGLNDWQQALVADYTQRPSPREVAEYPVWRQRLLRISEASRKEGAWSIKRLWYDNRDESLWWTRWGLITAGILALIFGFIQSITGIIQVVCAAKSSG
ncbi:hypothetical protein QBC38DRAFT_487974 [Podospora fimiseda]|uniref:Uncharacterized protein n=1 Tax=Podospora fimiseda TaxID=252190 RepID=A0AAN7BH95_9PEZI|nr:hypothetical protein QBC38DRAFT_487974 [Podospora fimiseda]